MILNSLRVWLQSVIDFFLMSPKDAPTQCQLRVEDVGEFMELFVYLALFQEFHALFYHGVASGDLMAVLFMMESRRRYGSRYVISLH